MGRSRWLAGGHASPCTLDRQGIQGAGVREGAGVRVGAGAGAGAGADAGADAGTSTGQVKRYRRREGAGGE